MANVLVNDESLTNIANAIRAKNGTNNSYKVSEMASAINDLSSSGNYEANDVYTVVESANKTAHLVTYADETGLHQYYVQSPYMTKAICGDNLYCGQFYGTDVTSIDVNGATQIPQSFCYACDSLTTLNGTDNVEIVDIGAFEKCSNLRLKAPFPKCYYYGNYAFNNAKVDFSNLASYTGEKPMYIGTEAFRYCSTFGSTLNLPVCSYIGSKAFAGTNIQTVNIKGAAIAANYGDSSGFAADAFPTTVTTINVPWSAGEVANAPWGATNATINYNVSM